MFYWISTFIYRKTFAILFLLPSLGKEDLVLKDYQYTPENVRKVELELFNKTQDTTFDLRKDKKLLALWH